MSRVGLGRHGMLDSDAGDPLDGLVNMFDLGLVLAVAFLIAGLAISAAKDHTTPKTSSARQTLTTPSSQRSASGEGRAVGQVYQLASGQLVLVRPDSGATSAAP
jgi:hypothetical protein